MKKNIVLALAIMASVACLGSCAKDTVENGGGATTSAGGEVTFLQTISSRVTGSDFDSNDIISITSYSDSFSTVVDSDVNYYWGGTAFVLDSGDAIELKEGDQMAYVAIYPAKTGTSFTHEIATDQSSGYSTSDLLVAKEALTSETTVDLGFYHVLSKISLEVVIDDQRGDFYADQVISHGTPSISAVASVSCDAIAGTYSANGSATTITPYSGTTYSAIIAPQSYTAGAALATMDLAVTPSVGDATSYAGEECLLESALTLESGKLYEVTWTITFEANGTASSAVAVTVSSDIDAWGSVDCGSDSVEVGYHAPIIENSTITGMSLTATYGDMTCRGGDWSACNISQTLDGITFIEDDFSSVDRTCNGFIGGANDLHKTLTYDLGKEYNLTEFKMWHRRWTQVYGGGNFQYFKIWGAGEEASSNNGSSLDSNYLSMKTYVYTDGSESISTRTIPDFETMSANGYWTLLLDISEGNEQGYTDPGGAYSTGLMYSDYISETSNSDISNIDAALNDKQVAAIEGYSFTLSNQDLAVRYIRIQPVQIWTGTYTPDISTYPMAGEIQLRGEVVE